MKSIKIKGNNKLNYLNETKKKSLTRSCVDYEEPNHEYQLKLVNKYFMGHTDDYEEYVKREISRKISGYKCQDVKKNIYDEKLIINKDDIIEKLVISKLLCYYCKKNMKVLFSESRDQEQWTLDRIDNKKCHSKDNTVCCCLKCNLDRRLIDFNKFNFTKNLVINKVN